MRRRDFLKSAAAAASMSLSPRVVLAQSAGTFNVRDFGAKGDGATDDGPAINAALRAAIASGEGASLLFPSGRYRLATISQAMARSIYAKADTGIDLTRQGGYLIKAHLIVNGAKQLTISGEPGTILLMK